jgi:SAM-dependent methyltransferase
MVERTQPQDEGWAAVDAYIGDTLLGEDSALAGALAANAAGGLPDIDVSPAQGRMLRLFAMMVGARRVLEVGTLGGYSTIELARAVGEGGRVVTLEIDPHHAEVARANVAAAGVGDRASPARAHCSTLSPPNPASRQPRSRRSAAKNGTGFCWRWSAEAAIRESENGPLPPGFRLSFGAKWRK